MKSSRSLCLLVGDERDDSLSALCRLLRLSGHVVHEADSVTKLRELASSGQCEAVIIEPGMEEGAGLELIDEFRAANLKTVALTSHDSPKWINAIHQAGFDRCLLKPIQYDDLLHVLDDLVS